MYKSEFVVQIIYIMIRWDRMEKIIWVKSWCGLKPNDGLDEVNAYLEQGWKVKLISACAMGDSASSGQAYVILEK